MEEGRIRSTAESLQKHFGSEGRMRIALETGTHSPWVSRLLQGLGHEIIVANPKQVKLITESTRKDDRLDVERDQEYVLARICAAGPDRALCHSAGLTHAFDNGARQARLASQAVDLTISFFGKSARYRLLRAKTSS